MEHHRRRRRHPRRQRIKINLALRQITAMKSLWFTAGFDLERTTEIASMFSWYAQKFSAKLLNLCMKANERDFRPIFGTFQQNAVSPVAFVSGLSIKPLQISDSGIIFKKKLSTKICVRARVSETEEHGPHCHLPTSKTNLNVHFRFLFGVCCWHRFLCAQKPKPESSKDCGFSPPPFSSYVNFTNSNWMFFGLISELTHTDTHTPMA